MKRRDLLIAAGCAIALTLGAGAAPPRSHGAEKASTSAKAGAREARVRGTVEQGVTQGTLVIRVVSPRKRLSILTVSPDSPKAAEVAELLGREVVARGVKVGPKGHEMLSVSGVEEVTAKAKP